MAHRRFEFEMPASAAVAFDVFHYHAWRARWDSLVGQAHVVGGAPCAFVGAETENTGNRWLKVLSMRTRFVAFDRPRLAAATMIGTSFPFSKWAASMKHTDIGEGRSTLTYTYTIESTPRSLRWLMEPVVDWVFARQTKQRFERMAWFLDRHAHEVATWQRQQGLA